MTPKRQTQVGNQWKIVQAAAGGSNSIPTRQHPELGQADRARMNHQSVQRATASQAGSSSTQAQCPRKKNILLLRTRSRILRFERRREVQQHTRFHHIICLHSASRCTTHQVVFKLRCSAASFSSLLLDVQIEEPGWKQTNH